MRDVWIELSESMRRLRSNAGRSLRRVEAESGTGRGTLSQVETGKARPNRNLVEWYDTEFGGDGLLLSLYAEARSARGPEASRPTEIRSAPGDAVTIVAVEPPLGALVPTASTLVVSWTLRNTGSVPWRGRRLRRVGARSGRRLLASDASVPVPDCDPGEQIVVRARLDVPAVAATYAAAWQMVDLPGAIVLSADPAFVVLLVAG